MRHLGKNLVIVLALVAAGFLAAWLRFRAHLGTEGSYTDGVATYDVDSSDEVRYAVWDRAVPLGGDVNSPADERRPALSPDGRLFVFCAGERGLGADLFVAELVDGVPRDVRPIAALNTDADEWAPCFAEGWLYFASDRLGTAGGLDVFRARYEDGWFHEPERLRGDVNGPADDTDPAPVPGGAGIVFASNRRLASLASFDLYLAQPAEETAATEIGEAEIGGDSWTVEPLEALNTAFDERDPAFTADGRTLFFASDRSGSRGGFDLYRSGLGKDGWVSPEPLVGVNSERSERGPRPGQDGFDLLFSVEGGDGGEDAGAASADLFRARSRELFRTPGRPVGWLELLWLGALLLLALLAWLAKEWEQLEVLYKCLLISLVVHLLLMLLFRGMYPEGEEYELRGDSNRMRVRLVSNPEGELARNAERGGNLAVAREELLAESAVERLTGASAEMASSAAAEPIRLARAEGEQAAAPARAVGAAPAPAERSTERVETRAPEAAFERLAGGTAELSVAAASTGERATRPEGSAVRGAGAESRVASDAAPEAAPVERGSTRAALPGAPGPASASELPTERTDANAIAAVAQPSTDFERLEGSASALAVDARPSAERGARPEAQAARGAPSAPDPLATAAVPAPEATALELPDAGPVGAGGAGAERSPAAERRSVAALSELSAAELADAEPQPFERLAGAPAEPADLLAGARLDRARPDAERDALLAAPATAPLPADRGEPELEPSAAARLTPSPRRAEPDAPGRASEAVAAAPGERERVPVELARERAEDEPLRGRGSATDPATLVELESGVERRLEDGLLALAAPELPRESAAAAPPPARLDRDRRPRVEPTPEFRPLNAVEVEERVEDGPLRITQWEHTPYRSRSGAEKLRALELHGGSQETEAAVAAGLAYLASKQRENGYWGSPDDRHPKYEHVAIGKTGLAMLAFLGAGHTQESDTEYSHVVEGAIRFLLAVQDDETGHFGYCTSYSHGIATYALAECYALTSDPRLKEPLERSVAWIVSKQHRSPDSRLHGGWGYYYPDGRTFDAWPRASVTAWQVMALESARLGRLEVEDRVFDDARTFLKNCWDDRRGAFRYSHDPERLSGAYDVLPGSTPATLFALSLLGDAIGGRRYGPARAFVLDRKPDRYEYTSDDDFVYRARGNLYFWYYATLAMFRVGGEPWEEWNEGMKGALLPSQQADGSWRPISIYALEYANDTDDQRIYTTAMCVLTLEVYYRYFTPLLKVE